MKLRTRVDAEPSTPAEPPARPAFYALIGGGWREYVTLLHPPYTLWHLSYVALGAALSPTLRFDRLLASLVAFFLALGIGAHALDELAGRPLRTNIPRPVLIGLASAGLAGAVALGILGAVVVGPWLLAFIAGGVFIALAYNLEWFHGRFHTDFWFALAWGAFPFTTAFFASAGRLGVAVLFGAAFCFALSLAQRALSTRVRAVRRRARAIEGRVLYEDGSVEDIDRRWATVADERALLLMSASVALLATAALVARA